MPVGSPLTAAAARRVLSYDREVFRRFRSRVRRLPKRGAFAEREIGHHTLFGTLVHVLNVREAWFQFVIAEGARNGAAFFDRPGRHPEDWRGFDAYEGLVAEVQERFGGGLTDAGLARPAKAPWMPGRYTVGDAVLQVSYEQAHHLGEIIGALWQQDLASPRMTWIDVQRPPRGARGRR